MATCRSRARKIPTRTNNMKLLTLTLAAAMVMAATGCETTKPEIQAQAPAPPLKPFVPKFQPGTDLLGIPPTPVVYRSQYNHAPVQQPQPQPIIVTGQNAGTTIATQTDYGTVVSQFGGCRPPIYTAPVPIYTGNQTPTVYTMPIQQ
jgi:hypothetical protein